MSSSKWSFSSTSWMGDIDKHTSDCFSETRPALDMLCWVEPFPQKHVKVLTPVSQKMTLFGNEVVADVTLKVTCGHTRVEWGPNPT